MEGGRGKAGREGRLLARTLVRLQHQMTGSNKAEWMGMEKGRSNEFD